jgi:hypothetical protein
MKVLLVGPSMVLPDIATPGGFAVARRHVTAPLWNYSTMRAILMPRMSVATTQGLLRSRHTRSKILISHFLSTRYMTEEPAKQSGLRIVVLRRAGHLGSRLVIWCAHGLCNRDAER